MNTKNENEKRKITIRFFLYILAGAAMGACLSMAGFFVFAKLSLTRLLTDFYAVLLVCSPWIFLFFCLTAMILSYVFLALAKKQLANRDDWNEEDDDAFYRRTDRLLSFSVGISNLGMITLFMIFALVTIAVLGKYTNVILFFVCALAFLLSMIFLAFLQRKSIEQVRILNPEKKGDALDLHFKKKWLASSDEQERLATYAASYKAFSSLGIVFFVLYALLVLMIPFFNIGFLPFLCVGCMWLVPNAVYFWEASMEKPRQ